MITITIARLNHRQTYCACFVAGSAHGPRYEGVNRAELHHAAPRIRASPCADRSRQFHPTSYLEVTACPRSRYAPRACGSAAAPVKVDRRALTDVGTAPGLDYADPRMWLCPPGNDPDECDSKPGCDRAPSRRQPLARSTRQGRQPRLRPLLCLRHRQAHQRRAHDGLVEHRLTITSARWGRSGSDVRGSLSAAMPPAEAPMPATATRVCDCSSGSIAGSMMPRGEPFA